MQYPLKMQIVVSMQTELMNGCYVNSSAENVTKCVNGMSLLIIMSNDKTSKFF